MTILTAILCRAFGHKPYEHPHLVWKPYSPRGYPLEAVPTMIKRCKRCNAKLGSRPMGAGEDETSIEACKGQKQAVAIAYAEKRKSTRGKK